jgi:hypothetical protein
MHECKYESRVRERKGKIGFSSKIDKRIRTNF